MANLVVLRGLPASGKTLYAAKLVAKNYKRVSTADLRLSIDNGVYSKQNEQLLTEVTQTLITLFLQNGCNVVLDNYNLNPYHIRFCKSVALELNATLEIVNLDTPLDICIARDLARNNGRVGKDVILKLYNKYFINGKFPEVLE